MGELKFDVLKKLVYDYYAKCKYEKSLDVARLAADNFPDKLAQTNYWLACLYSRLGRSNEAIRVLRECVEKGIWWSPKKLLEDEDLFPIHQDTSFHEIIHKCRTLEEAAQKNTLPELVVHTPKNYTSKKAYPLLMTLHWRNGNAMDYSQKWNTSYLLDEFILAFPQSSQASAINEYHWDNEALGEKEIRTHYQELLEKYNIHTTRTIIAGASQGAKLAIKMALRNNSCYFKGFIAVIPAIDEIQALLPYVSDAYEKGVRGCIIAGEQDPYYPKALALYDALKHRNFPCKFIKVNTLGHYLPDDFHKHLRAAIQFIL